MANNVYYNDVVTLMIDRANDGIIRGYLGYQYVII